MSYEDMSLESYGPSGSDPVPELTTFDSIEHHAQTLESVMDEREAELLRTFETIHTQTPEQERVLEALKERTLALSGPRIDLKIAAQTAALTVALEGLMSGTEDRSPESELQAARLMTKNPELADMLMQRIFAMPEHLGHEGSHTSEANTKLRAEAKEVLQEMEGSDSKVFKGVALRTAERITRALISAGTLGVGGIVYDSAKDLYVNLRARSELRTKQRLMASTTILTS
ncbi:MAG: hypothetical protein QG636_385 [Patescibacteria group bacterium]|nr:hypothetical protein [Patescibacteria group bacterium]